MALFTLAEIIDIVIMTFVIGFIFKDVFRHQPKVQVITPDYYLKQKKGFNWTDLWFAAAIVAPSVILHEFGHKFVALANGMTASFHAAYTWLVIGIILKLVSAGFIFFVPAYVAISGTGTPLQLAGISFAGPAVNLVLWLGGLALMKTTKLKRGAYRFVFLVSRINMFLFIFNMLPIPGFDGFGVYSNLFKAVF